MSDISERLIRLLEKQTGKTFENLDPDTQLEALGIDSFDFIEFLFLVEDEFDVDVDYKANDFANRMKTVGDVATVIGELIAARQGSQIAAAKPLAS